MDGDWKNRARHLPLVIGENHELGEFLDQLREEPAALYAMHFGAERLLLEPARTACLLKFATILHGLSIPLAELVWPETATDSIRRALILTAPRAPTPAAAPTTKSKKSATAKSKPVSSEKKQTTKRATKQDIKDAKQDAKQDEKRVGSRTKPLSTQSPLSGAKKAETLADGQPISPPPFFIKGNGGSLRELLAQLP
jgi:hypothetical protein